MTEFFFPLFLAFLGALYFAAWKRSVWAGLWMLTILCLVIHVFWRNA